MIPSPVRSPGPPSSIEEYELLREIGRGAMGSIHLARDTLLDRDVAVKLITVQSLDREAKGRFLHEARALARVAHPNVVAVYRAGEVGGRPYLVTELVRGGSLADLPKPVPHDRALRLGIGVARGLAAAHRRSVLHRDIKPDNVMLGEDGEVKLVDFGLAKLLGDAEPGEPRRIERLDTRPVLVSASGEMAGTPLYMAPEVFYGAPATVESDLFSVGALLYELLTGVAPRETLPEDLPLSDWIAAAPTPLHEPPRATGVDPRLGRIVHRCLASRPKDRFPSAEALAEALEILVEGQSEDKDVTAGDPYRGLLSFEAEHRGVFFGRESETRALVRRLKDEGFVIVAGDSGVGKSSLCKAGVLPRVTAGLPFGATRYRAVTLVPGAHPVSALTRALVSSGALEESQDLASLLEGDSAALYREVVRRLDAECGLFIFVDQLEEICTLASREEAMLFGAAIARLCVGPRVRGLLTLRADFLTSIASLGSFGPDLEARLFLVRPMSEEGIRAAITKPALRKGVVFESEDLVDELTRAAAEAPGGLPLLEFAMAEIWRARDDGEGAITARSLAKVGSVSGALSHHADRVMNALQPAEQGAARRALVRLVNADRTRARRPLVEMVGDDPIARTAVEALIQGRLIIARKMGTESVVEIAHEVLVREWPALRKWLDEATDQQALSQEIDQAAELWDRRGRREEEAWSGDALEQALSRSRKWSLPLSPVARAFLAAGETKARRGQVRRRWAFAVGVGALSILAAVSTIAAFAFAEKERQAIAQQAQIRLAAADMGEIDLTLSPFDWDPVAQRASPAEIPSNLEVRIHAIDAVDPRSPGRLLGSEEMRLGEVVRRDGEWRARVEVRSGPAFLEVRNRGGDCAPSWVYFQRLPGYTDRLATGAVSVRVPVPTCAASRADTLEIPAGPFYLNTGAPDADHGPDDERAELSSYRIDRTEVTQAAFKIYGALEPLTGDGAAQGSFLELDRPGKERFPVVAINALTAASYCRFLGKELPSIAEWQKAMRGGMEVNGAPNPAPKRLHPWIEAKSKRPANLDDGEATLAEVGVFPDDTSPYGVVDLGGNVSEWSREKVVVPAGLRFLLGGSWGTPPEHAGWRNKRAERYFDFSIGARCVLQEATR